MGSAHPKERNEKFPETVRERPRTYFISGGLGAALFTASGLLEKEYPFISSLLLELGGGAFIVFLLEFLLPRFLTYADGATRVLRVTELTWSPEAVLAVTDYGESEVDELFEGCERATYPGRTSARNGVHDTGTRINGFRVFSQQIAPHSLLFYYVPRRGRLRKKRVVIVAVTRLSGLPASLQSPEQGTT